MKRILTSMIVVGLIVSVPVLAYSLIMPTEDNVVISTAISPIAGLEGLGDVGVGLQDAAVVLNKSLLQRLSISDPVLSKSLNRISITDPNDRMLLIALSTPGVTSTQVKSFATTELELSPADADSTIERLTGKKTILTAQFNSARGDFSRITNVSTISPDTRVSLQDNLLDVITDAEADIKASDDADTKFAKKLKFFATELTLEDYLQ